MCPIHGEKDQTHITIQPGQALLMTHKRKDRRIPSCTPDPTRSPVPRLHVRVDHAPQTLAYICIQLRARGQRCFASEGTAGLK